MKEKFFITTPIYYVNAEPHIGHTISTLVADALARWQTVQGKQVWFSTGTDEHGTKVAKAARFAGLSPKRFVDKIAALYKKTWEILEISNTDFIRTTQDRHKKAVDEFIKTLKAENVLYKADYKGLYCDACEAFLDKKELKNGLCPIHLLPPRKIVEKNWFFKLSKFSTVLRRKIISGELEIIPERARSEALAFLEKGLRDISISRQSVKWGIPLVFDNSQTVYVWIDALVNYLTTVGFPSEKKKFDLFWPADLHIIGKEILRFHCIIWPALLLAAGLALPKKIFVHNFLSLQGEKISKTRGNVFSPQELVNLFGSSATRYLILSQTPYSRDADIRLGELKSKYNAELAGGIGNLFSRIILLAQKKQIKKIPRQRTRAGQKALEKSCSENWKQFSIYMAKCDIKSAIAAAQKNITLADKYIDRTRPWTIQNRQETEQILLPALEIFRQSCLMLYPFIPSTAEKALRTLGLKFPAGGRNLLASKEWLSSGFIIPQEKIHLFKKLD